MDFACGYTENVQYNVKPLLQIKMSGFHLCATNKLILDVPSCHLIILFCICVPDNTYVIFIPLFMHYCLHHDKGAINKTRYQPHCVYKICCISLAITGSLPLLLSPLLLPFSCEDWSWEVHTLVVCLSGKWKKEIIDFSRWGRLKERRRQTFHYWVIYPPVIS